MLNVGGYSLSKFNIQFQKSNGITIVDMPKSIEPHTFELRNNSFVVIREAEPSDAKELIDFVNCVGGESDYLTLGVGDFKLTEVEEAEFLSEC